MPFCHQCGAENPDSARFCDQCGAALIHVTGHAIPPPAPVLPAMEATIVATPAATGGMTCPQCGMPVMPGEAFCDSCGAPLSPPGRAVASSPAPTAPPFSSVPPQPTYPAPQLVGISGPPAPAAPVPPASAAPVSPGRSVVPAAPAVPATPPAPAPAARHTSLAALRLVLQPNGQILPLPATTRATIGRADPVSNFYPEIDLTPYGALDQGVGRRHMQLMIQRGQIVAEDLDSTNGSFLNGQKLPPHTPQPLRDGDELRLGRLVLKVQASA